MSQPITPETYQSYRRLPMLAGVATMTEAVRPGLSVEQCVMRLKRYHYAFKRLHQILTARITAEPIYELKSAFSLHAYLCSEHVTTLRQRVGEMREPPLGLDVVPDTHLELFFDEILNAPTTEELVVGVYDKAMPALHAAMTRHIHDTNSLFDHPSVRVCRFALLELNDMLDFGKKALACLVDSTQRTAMTDWLALLDQCLLAAGSLDGADGAKLSPISRRYSAKPYVYDGVPRRDERFLDLYNQGVNAEAFLYNEKMPANAKTLMLFFKRLREIDVPEMMASIITETPGKPWPYYRDMSRQLWDEARHAMMGEVGFTMSGVDWKLARITFNWSLNLNTQLKPIERHAVLFYIEQGLMPKTGKRYEWEVGVASGNPLAAMAQDYDWADEVLHAAIGRTWYVKDYPSTKEAIAYGDECWSKILASWASYRERGLTEHANWWPEVYRQACAHWGIAPDPVVLGYSENYATVRADLKEISTSG